MPKLVHWEGLPSQIRVSSSFMGNPQGCRNCSHSKRSGEAAPPGGSTPPSAAQDAPDFLSQHLRLLFAASLPDGLLVRGKHFEEIVDGAALLQLELEEVGAEARGAHHRLLHE